MTPTFSVRQGIVPATKPLQVDSMDDDLVIGLWNVIKLYAIDKMPARNRSGVTSNDLHHFAQVVWFHILKRPVDEVDFSSHYKLWKEIKEWFFATTWNRRYDLLECIAAINAFGISPEEIQAAANRILERECSGWRFLSGRLVPISNETEMEAVTSAIDMTASIPSLEGANLHLKEASDLLSERDQRDYRNTIKEAVQAVEMVVRRLTDESTLGKGLDALEGKGLVLNKQLRTAFEKMYAYSNSKESGIRHAIMEASSAPDFDDAKYMVVTCSAFVNFLVGKSRTLGVAL